MHSLNPVRTVGQQIMEALELHVADGWRTDKARKVRVTELLQAVDLVPTKADAYPHELSGGQKQRVMIAMALACEPHIIIADEPTTALDVIVQKQILDMISALVAERGISMMMISHDLSVLATACERIAVMRDGELVEVGDAYEVCTSPQHPYTRQLAEAFPTIGDPASRLNPVTRRTDAVRAGAREISDEVLLEARNVTVTYHGRGKPLAAVKNVSLSLRRGEILALVGQSGSGKTTLARTVVGLQQADEGSVIRFRDKDIPRRGRALRDFRSEVQMVLQDPSAALNPKLSIYESIAEGLRVQRYPGDEQERVAQSLVDAELTPPERFFSAIPQELSGGQRQRAVIAGALAVGPQLLVADEPVWNIADTVAVMYEGALVEYGTTEQVLLDPQHDYTRRLLDAAPSIERRLA
jgi:ABC-type glutathione transport system ATPase component